MILQGVSLLPFPLDLIIHNETIPLRGIDSHRFNRIVIVSQRLNALSNLKRRFIILTECFFIPFAYG
jgi:hypothetical protein